MRFRLIPLPLVLLLASGMLFANGETVLLDPAWSILEKAEIAYEKGELGEALAACEDARQLHSETMLTYEKKLHTAVTPTVMKRTGGTIPEIRTMMADRNENEAAAILDSVLSVHDAKYFDNSIEKLMNWLTVRTAYPEADMLCGAIYSAEGEYDLAIKYYLVAWEQRSLLQLPDERFTICYRMADIARVTGDYGSQEQYLLLVLTEDTIFGKPGKESPSLLAMKRTLMESTDCEKFFSLYRHDGKFAIKAYKDLTAFYFKRSGDRLENALSTATLAAVTSVTILDSFLQRKNIAYEYTSFSDLLERASEYPEIVQEADRLDLWTSFLDLGDVLFAMNHMDVARSIVKNILLYCPDRTVSQQAQGLLQKNDAKDYE